MKLMLQEPSESTVTAFAQCMAGSVEIKYIENSLKNKSYCEMLRGLVVLVEVDTGSVVLLHGVAGQ